MSYDGGHDDLLAHVRSLVHQIEQADNTIQTREEELERMRADSLAMKQRLGSLERFLSGEDIDLPYSGRKGT